MKYSVLTILICLCMGYSASSQEAAEEECSDKMYFSKAERMPVYKKSMDSLKTFFSKLTVSSFTADNVTGIILLDITVCSNGKASFNTFTNKTDWPIDTAVFKNAIASMGLWAPGFQNGREVTCVVSLELDIEYGTLMKFRYINNSL